ATLWKYSYRGLQRRPGRALLTLLGIVIGVAAVVATSWTARATHGAYRAMFESMAGRAALEVVADGAGGFDAALADELERIPGIKAAVPVVQVPTAIFDRGGAVPVLLLGIE